MEDKRLYELLANAVICFKRCMSPFSHNQLLKHDVKSDECRGLSYQIGSIIEEWLYIIEDPKTVDELLKRFEEENKDA